MKVLPKKISWDFWSVPSKRFLILNFFQAPNDNVLSVRVSVLFLLDPNLTRKLLPIFFSPKIWAILLFHQSFGSWSRISFLCSQQKCCLLKFWVFACKFSVTKLALLVKWKIVPWFDENSSSHFFRKRALFPGLPNGTDLQNAELFYFTTVKAKYKLFWALCGRHSFFLDDFTALLLFLAADAFYSAQERKPALGIDDSLSRESK